MLIKILFSSMIVLLSLDVSTTLKARGENKNSLINKFCLASLKSKLNIKNKQKVDEISHFTCECFFKKYNSGSSIRSSRVYCKNKTEERYTL